MHPGALGDVILFGHLLRRLPGAITLLAGAEKGRLLAEAGIVTTYLDFDALPIHEVFSDVPLDRCDLPGRLGSFGRLVSCFAAGDPRAESRLAQMCHTKQADFLPVRPPPDTNGHLLELWAERLSLPRADRPAPTAWCVPPAWKAAAGDALAACGLQGAQNLIAIHPGAGATEKCWPLDRFLKLADALASHSRPVAFVIGPVEAERWPAQQTDSLRRRFPLLVCPPLAALAGVFGSCRAAICNDSGPAHLAAAVGTHTVALSGPSRALQFAPIGPDVRVIAAATMDAIAVEEVLAAAGV